MAFKDLGDALHGAYIELPLGGRVYRIDDVSAETALYVERVMSVGASLATEQAVSDEDIEVLDDDGERDLYRRVMGDTYDEMIRDGVGWQAVKHAAWTTLVWILRDEETAARYWESGGGSSALGEAMAPAGNRASRRASAAAARGTRGPASTNGTRASRPRPPRDRSRGRRS